LCNKYRDRVSSLNKKGEKAIKKNSLPRIRHTIAQLKTSFFFSANLRIFVRESEFQMRKIRDLRLKRQGGTQIKQNFNRFEVEVDSSNGNKVFFFRKKNK